MRFFLLFMGILFFPLCSKASPLRLFLDFTPPPKEIYIGQETLFTIKLFDRIGLRNIMIVPPEWPNTDVFLQEEPQGTPVEQNGTSYTLNEFNFSLVVKTTGQIFFSPLCITAEAPSMISVRDLPDTIGVSSTGVIQICTPPYFIEIKKLPDHSPPLFAAENVELFDGIVPETTTVTAGSPVKRSLLMAAKGTVPAFLPEFKTEKIDGIRIYNGKLERSSPPAKDKLMAALRQTIIFIPEKTGELVLPEIKVYWLNTLTNKIQTSVVPAHKLTVLPSTDAEAPEPEEPQSLKEEKNKFPYLLWGILIPSAGLLLLVLSVVKRKKKKNQILIKAIKDACLQGEMEKTAACILQWASETFRGKQFLNLADVRQLFEGKCDDFVLQLEELEKYLYGTGRFAKHLPMTGKKLGEDILEAFNEAIRVKHKKIKSEKKFLPPLYPEKDDKS